MVLPSRRHLLVRHLFAGAAVDVSVTPTLSTHIQSSSTGRGINIIYLCPSTSHYLASNGEKRLCCVLFLAQHRPSTISWGFGARPGGRLMGSFHYSKVKRAISKFRGGFNNHSTERPTRLIRRLSQVLWSHWC